MSKILEENSREQNQEFRSGKKKRSCKEKNKGLDNMVR